MKRFVTLAVLLLIALPVAALEDVDGSYPPWIYGDRLANVEEVTEFTYMTVQNEWWSMPNVYGYTLPIFARVTPDSAFLQMENGTTWHLAWTEACQCYATWTAPDPETIVFTAMTGLEYSGGWTGFLRHGTLLFEGHPPQFWDLDPTALLWMGIVNPQSPPPLLGDAPPAASAFE